ncbi:MAG: hypothetical protein A3D92_19290 [Bacteroidetes bacterium RIFCSPHIGHO2_02_FULL_44_7]|nr:MAG: hypothetical protein A3D92_19290 [Bacteroidetes bacterium RIFCSPHIGHO2_02_FULL_44_7]
MLVSRFPYPLDKGDKLRAFYQLQELSRYYDVTLVAISDETISPKKHQAVKDYCREMYIFKIGFVSKVLHLAAGFFHKRPFQTGYFYSWTAARKIQQLIDASNFEHVYCQLIRTTEYVKNEHRVPKTLDYMDALSAGIQRRIGHQAFYSRWLFRSEARRLSNYERSIFDYFEHTTIISEQDRELIQHPDRKKIHIIPNGIHSSFFNVPNIEAKHDFVFVGNMSYPPNVEAVQFIADHILPAFKGATLLVSGSSPAPQIRNLAQHNPQIHVTGWVDDIREAYCSGKIFLAPMFIGTGMQNKLLEAMALGVPCVTTPLANNAIRAANNLEIMVGSTKEELIDAIHILRENPEFSKALSKAGSAFIRAHYSWEKSVAELRKIMELAYGKKGG